MEQLALLGGVLRDLVKIKRSTKLGHCLAFKITVACCCNVMIQRSRPDCIHGLLFFIIALLTLKFSDKIN